MLELIAVLTLQIIYQTCKALTDGWLWYRHSWIEQFCIKHGWQNFYNGVEGQYWNYWHTFDTIRNFTEVASFVLALLFATSLAWWGILIFGWFCYWIPVFALIYHCGIGKDKTIKQVLIEAFKVF